MISLVPEEQIASAFYMACYCFAVFSTVLTYLFVLRR